MAKVVNQLALVFLVYLLALNSGLCAKQAQECESAFFLNENQECQRCDFRCLACETRDNNCSQCRPGFLLDEVNGWCSNTCYDGTFENTEAQSCQRCPETCTLCNQDQCTECKWNYFMQNGQCLESCVEGYYSNYQDYSCMECDSGCTSCLNIASKCTSCVSGLILNQYKCVTICPLQTYRTEDNTCSYCYSTCRTCQNATPNGCLECEAGFTLQEDYSCVYTASSYDGECKQCPSDTCQTCTSQGCTSCYESFALDSGNCILTCPDGTFNNGHFCQLCDSKCSQCSGPGDDQCQKCASGYKQQDTTCSIGCTRGYFFDGENCDACDSTCGQCNGPTPQDCRQCAEGLVLFNGECSQSCLTGFYQQDHECHPCLATCLECNGPWDTSCIACKPGKFLSGSECVQQCLPDEYPDNSTQICTPCHENCATCSGPTSDDCIVANRIINQRMIHWDGLDEDQNETDQVDDQPEVEQILDGEDGESTAFSPISMVQMTSNKRLRNMIQRHLGQFRYF